MIYVSSDWHGTAPDKIKALLDGAGFGKDDFLFVLGDVIDRGKHGVELLKYMMRQPNIELILGNHEAMMLSCSFLFDEVTDESVRDFNALKMKKLATWQYNGAEPTINALSKESHAMREAILDYLYDAPMWDSVEVGGQNYLLVHGGLGDYRKDRPIEDYSETELVWTRPTLSTVYSRDFITIVGHTPTLIHSKEYRNRIIKTDTWWDIDTGAACGCAPMVLCLDTLKEYYIEGDMVICK